ncbi:hypothetical protein Ais01nite_42040 [Asanoa ishikariensis]|uniref:DUF4386 family protein n=1 Tax=Asanoa ishikariensis TaxID=137265 RepID=A0A1H3MKW0_9ACTN|nr:hypothetical protein [Asanoa ishikariensis]GIF66169.1 hypothetical protein Ais01nite_42040 [Asanoa ishikariensis]SDY76729.1 hypothetical protein SAMN05421684_1444 [Asanoa ishikariensis]
MDTRRLSRIIGAAVLVLAPLGLVAGTLTEPHFDQDAPAVDQLAEVAEVAVPAAAARTLVALLILLMPIAVLFAARLARRGAPRLAAIGGALSFLAWSAGIASIGGVEAAYWFGSRLQDRATVAALLDSVSADPVYNTQLLVFVLGHLIGMLVLGIGLWRSRAVPAWVGILFGLSPFLHAVAMGMGPAVDAVAYGLLLVATTGCAVALYRTPDAEWDLPARTAVTPAPERVAA